MFYSCSHMATVGVKGLKKFYMQMKQRWKIKWLTAGQLKGSKLSTG